MNKKKKQKVHEKEKKKQQEKNYVNDTLLIFAWGFFSGCEGGLWGFFLCSFLCLFDWFDFFVVYLFFVCLCIFLRESSDLG